jgi:hypothetical protein
MSDNPKAHIWVHSHCRLRKAPQAVAMAINQN